MEKNIIFGVLVLFLELTIFIMPGYLLLVPSIVDTESKSIILDNEPKSSQINLKIIVSDQQAPTIIGVIDDFLADSLGSGVNLLLLLSVLVISLITVVYKKNRDIN